MLNYHVYHEITQNFNQFQLMHTRISGILILLYGFLFQLPQRDVVCVLKTLYSVPPADACPGWRNVGRLHLEAFRQLLPERGHKPLPIGGRLYRVVRRNVPVRVHLPVLLVVLPLSLRRSCFEERRVARYKACAQIDHHFL